MPKEKQVEEEEKEYPITVSDWVIFLSNKSSQKWNIWVLFVSIFVAALIGIIAQYTALDIPAVILLPAGIFLYFIFRLFGNLLQKDTGRYENILERVMQGELTEPKEILKEYNKIG